MYILINSKSCNTKSLFIHLTSTSDQTTPVQLWAQDLTAQGKKFNPIIKHSWERWH